MLGLKKLLLLILILFLPVFADNDIKNDNDMFFKKEELKELEFRYKTAVDMYRKGSYYSAIEEIYPVLRKFKNPYYPDALFLMSKIYLHIGKKTGKKDFLVKSLYFLNTYLYSSKNATENWDFYYTRGSIYENLYQYEKALSDYKLAYVKAKTPDAQFKSLIALLRTAAWMNNIDIATRYLFLINLEELSKKQKNEFLFVKGLLNFQQGKYKEAFNSLSKVYKEYEQLLIDNPYYYLIVAETAYRYGKLTFAQQLFRRIISTVKDPYIIRNALLRLGDIQLKQNYPVYAFNYYYSVVEKYPKTQEAKIAKLKILSAGEKYKKIKRKINYLKEKDEDFKKPFVFVFKTWISNRNNYLGDFAFGNFAYMVLNIKSENLFKKFLWELSLLSSSSLKYEHKEHIYNLLKDVLPKTDTKKICLMYTTNPDFFKKVFIKNWSVVSYIINSLYLCGKNKYELSLAKYADQNWNTKNSKLTLAKAYLDNKMYSKAIKILKNIKDNSCRYYKINVQASLLMNKKPDVSLPQMERACVNDKEANVYLAVAYYLNNKPEKAVNKLVSIENLSNYYRNDPFIKNSIRKIINELLAKKDYQSVHKLVLTLTKGVEKDCYLNSIGLITSVRTDDKKNIKIFLDKINTCSSEISKIAKNIYKTYKVVKEIE